MKTPAVILKVSREVARWIAARWNAVVAPQETRTGAAVKVLDAAVDVAVKVEKQRRQQIEWTIRQYRVMGLTTREIRSKILPLIEQGTDPLSIIRVLAAKGAITAIRIQGDHDPGEETPIPPD